MVDYDSCCFAILRDIYDVEVVGLWNVSQLGNHSSNRLGKTISPKITPQAHNLEGRYQLLETLIINMASELHEDGCYVALSHDYLDAKSMMDRVRSPKAGAIVLFAGKIDWLSVRGLVLTVSRHNTRQFCWKASQGASIYIL